MLFSFKMNIENGFLSHQHPLVSLPETSKFNIELNQLTKKIPDLLKNNSLRREVDKLNENYADTLISLEKNNIPQYNIAALTLLLITQVYIWEKIEAPAQIIPSLLSKNVYCICKAQHRFPILTYSDYVLHNWFLIDTHKKIGIDNIEPIVTITSSKDEAWFIKIHIAIEATCASALKAAYQLAYFSQQIIKENIAFKTEDEEMVIVSLNTITTSLEQATTLLKKMRDQCDPDYYYNVIRIYLNGWDRIKNDGQEFTGVRLNNVFIKNKNPTYIYKGPSGAQSSLLPALDAALNIEHDIDDMYQTLLNFQQYMPKDHVLFIQLLNQSKLRQLIERFPQLEDSWNETINKLALFRLEHLKLVEDYIYQPAKKLGLQEQNLIGSGGSAIQEYLGNRYKSTVS